MPLWLEIALGVLGAIVLIYGFWFVVFVVALRIMFSDEKESQNHKDIRSRRFDGHDHHLR